MDFQEFIKPELLVLIPVLYFIGMGLKKTSLIKDKYIPLLIGIISILLSTIWVAANVNFADYRDWLTCLFTAFVQGILCAGASVYCNQMIKQTTKKEE